MTEPERPERESFVAQKLGDLYAETAKLVAMLDRVVSTDSVRVSGGNRWLLYIVIVLLLILISLLAAHIAYSAGWFDG